MVNCNSRLTQTLRPFVVARVAVSLARFWPSKWLAQGCNAGSGNGLLLSGATCQSVNAIYEWRPLFGEKDMTKGTPIQAREHRTQYASHEDFHTIFNENLKELYQLSFLLTRDLARAERCFVSGVEDSVPGNRLS